MKEKIEEERNVGKYPEDPSIAYEIHSCQARPCEMKRDKEIDARVAELAWDRRSAGGSYVTISNVRRALSSFTSNYTGI
jgi:hypothetical protein